MDSKCHFLFRTAHRRVPFPSAHCLPWSHRWQHVLARTAAAEVGHGTAAMLCAQVPQVRLTRRMGHMPGGGVVHHHLDGLPQGGDQPANQGKDEQQTRHEVNL
jgi:hypothetical protein